MKKIFSVITALLVTFSVTWAQNDNTSSDTNQPSPNIEMSPEMKAYVNHLMGLDKPQSTASKAPRKVSASSWSYPTSTPTTPFGGGTGTEANPYLISTPQQLANLAYMVNNGTTYSGYYFKMTDDIVLNSNVLAADGSLNSGSFQEWTPIGTSSNYFKGTFDGDGHSITGANINASSTSSIGLFGCIYNATIKNLGLKDSYIYGYQSVGGICGYSMGGTIQKCYNNSTILGSCNIGGICGRTYTGGTTTYITQCYNSGKVTATTGSVQNYIAGICGWANAGTNINYCYNTGAISGSNNYVAGVVGALECSGNVITKCFNIGSINCTSTYQNGPIVGWNSSSYGTTTYCYYLSTCCPNKYQPNIGGVSNNYSETSTQFADGTVLSLIDPSGTYFQQGANGYPVLIGVGEGANNTYLYIDSIATVPSTATTVSVKMKNDCIISGFQFDLSLPTGVSLNSITSSTARTSFTYSVSNLTQADGSIRIVCYPSSSASSARFTGTDGEVLRLSLTSTSSGNKTITLKNQRLTTSTLSEITPSSQTATIHVHNLSSTDNGSSTHTTTCSLCSYSVTGSHTYVIGVCSVCGHVQSVPVTSITLSSTSATLVTGNTKTLTATISPSTATNKSVTWSSSNTSVATVSSSGVVTAVAVGTATITCTAADGSGVNATCAIKVTGNLSGRSSVVTTNTASASYSFSTTGTYEWEWDSSNSRLRSTNYNVHSTTSQTTMTITTSKSTAFSFNYAVSSESSYDKLTITLDGTTIANAISGTSSSSYTSIMSSGSHTLVMQYTKDGSTNSNDDRAYISNVKFESIPVTSISLNSTSATLVTGNTKTLTATVSPTTASNTSVTWSSSNTSVATVSSSGVVTAVAVGTATITCTAADGSGVNATCAIKVTGNLSGRSSVVTTNTASASYSFSTTGTYEWEWDSSNSRLRSTNYNVHSTTSQTTMTITTSKSTAFSFNYAVSSESSYDKLTITLDGTTIVNAISGTSSSSYTSIMSSGSHTLVMQYTKDGSANSNDDRAYISNIKFESIPVSSITLNSTSNKLVVGETFTLTATISPTAASNKSVTWSSSNTSVAKVTTDGIIKALSVGTTTITCLASDGSGVSKTCSITVIPRGDVNGDGSINTADITGDVKFILGQSTTGLYASAADYNYSGTYTTADAIAIVRLALTGSTAFSGARPMLSRSMTEETNALSIDDIKMSSGSTADFFVRLADNVDRFTSMQFDVTIPDGVTIENVTVGNRAVNHSAVYNDFENGTVRVICYSLDNEDFSATEGDVVRLTFRLSDSVLSGLYDVDFSNILLVRNDVSMVYSQNQKVSLTVGETTGINRISDFTDDDTLRYNIAGQRVNKNAKGVIISNGKKIFVK